MPIAIANYLASIKRMRVAVVNLSGKNLYEQMAWYFNQNIGNEGYFELFGVKYYSYYKEKLLPELLKENYDYIIFSGVQPSGNRSVDLACYHKNFIAGSLKPWEACEYTARLKKIYQAKLEKEYYFFAEYYEDKDVRSLEKENRISFIRLPVTLNPFCIKRTEFAFFESFL